MQSIPCGNESCNAQSLGTLLDGVLVRFAEIALFPPAATDSERKMAITSAYEAGELTGRQTAMLINAFDLREA
jgi:hypothetical protein